MNKSILFTKAHAMTKQVIAKFPDTDYRVTFGQCMKIIKNSIARTLALTNSTPLKPVTNLQTKNFAIGVYLSIQLIGLLIITANNLGIIQPILNMLQAINSITDFDALMITGLIQAFAILILMCIGFKHSLTPDTGYSKYRAFNTNISLF